MGTMTANVSIMTAKITLLSPLKGCYINAFKDS